MPDLSVRIDTSKLRKASKCVYLAVDATSVADELSGMLRAAADELDSRDAEIERLRLQIADFAARVDQA